MLFRWEGCGDEVVSGESSEATQSDKYKNLSGGLLLRSGPRRIILWSFSAEDSAPRVRTEVKYLGGKDIHAFTVTGEDKNTSYARHRRTFFSCPCTRDSCARHFTHASDVGSMC